MGFHSHGGTPSSHPFLEDFPAQKTTIYVPYPLWPWKPICVVYIYIYIYIYIHTYTHTYTCCILIKRKKQQLTSVVRRSGELNKAFNFF